MLVIHKNLSLWLVQWKKVNLIKFQLHNEPLLKVQVNFRASINISEFPTLHAFSCCFLSCHSRSITLSRASFCLWSSISSLPSFSACAIAVSFSICNKWKIHNRNFSPFFGTFTKNVLQEREKMELYHVLGIPPSFLSNVVLLPF